MQNKVAQAAEATLQRAIELIMMRWPDAERSGVQAFVGQQFAAMNADPNVVISAEGIAERYEAAMANPRAGDGGMQRRLAKLIFNGLSNRPPTQSLQYLELQHAFRVASGESLSDYIPDVDAVVEHLEAKAYIRMEMPGRRMPLFFRGIDFDQWCAEMTVEKSVKKNVGSVAAPVPPSQVTYHVTGNNARINHHATDLSTNVVLDGGQAQASLDALRHAIQSAELSERDRQSALDVVEVVDAQFASGAPKKSVITLLLDGLPKVADIATAVSTIAGLLK